MNYTLRVRSCVTFSLAKKVVSEAIERWDWSRNVLIGGSIGHVGVDEFKL